VAQGNITAVFTENRSSRRTARQQIANALYYIRKYSPYIDSVTFKSRPGTKAQAILGYWPPNLQLKSLQLDNLCLEQLDTCFESLLSTPAAAAALKQLRLCNCELLGDNYRNINFLHGWHNYPKPFIRSALDAALLQLPAGLEHLGIISPTSGSYESEDYRGRQLRADSACFHTDNLLRLQQLTHLELADVDVKSANNTSLARQPLEALTGLVHLRLASVVSDDALKAGLMADSIDGSINMDAMYMLSGAYELIVTASMLSGAERLTHLHLSGDVLVGPGVLAGKTQLQYLHMRGSTVSGGAAGVVQLLSHVQELQQLTHLNLGGTLQGFEECGPPAAAYAALTASSKLRHLDVSRCTLPEEVWQHLFPTSRKLPHLQSLNLDWVSHPSRECHNA
jgi:hypothetical protein